MHGHSQPIMMKTEKLSPDHGLAPTDTLIDKDSSPTKSELPLRKKMYRNCDTCRSAKRACDAKYSTILEAIASKVACTNCRKKGQVCTFNSLINAFGGIPLAGVSGAAFAESLNSTSNDLQCSNHNQSVTETLQPHKRAVPQESYSFSQSERDQDDETVSTSADSEPSTSSSENSYARKKRRTTSNASSVDDVLVSSLVLSRQESPCPKVAPACSSDLFDFLSFDIWGTSPNVRLSDSVDRLHLNSDLLGVYQGAAESAFKVWVTNATTPYLLSADSFNNSSGAITLNQKVCVLDQASKRFFKPSVGGECAEKRVSEAYHAVLLAYAAQWPRHRQKSNLSGSHWKPDEARIRLSLWKRARDKLMDAADAWSFRIVFALILFAWTEKPKEVPEGDHWNKADMEPLSHLNPPSLNENSALDSSSWQGPAEASTMMLAAAMRKLKSFRTKIQELHRRGIDPWATDCPSLDTQEVARRGAEASLLEKTYHNLFWLGVMMDTEIAVLRKHDPVISDEDTDLADQSLFSHRSDQQAGAADDGFGFGSPQKPMRKIFDEVIPANSQRNRESFVKAWPCSETDALRTLAFATPIKVLLFRHVGRLQAAYWRQSPSDQVERQITHMLSVIRHWDDTFAPFFSSCVANHASLPHSVQSWYTITLTKWNLAAILFVELVQSVDRSSASPFQNTQEVFSELRSKICNQTAALIHAIQHSTLKSSTSTSPSPFDFIEATDSTVLHTDPWVEITCHSISAVAKSEIRTLAGLAAENKWQELQCAQHRVEKCIWALEQLCNRSPMANDACIETKRLLQAHSPLKQDTPAPIDNLSTTAIDRFLADTQTQMMNVDVEAPLAPALIPATHMSDDIWQSCLKILGEPNADLTAPLDATESLFGKSGTTPSSSLPLSSGAETFLWQNFGHNGPTPSMFSSSPSAPSCIVPDPAFFLHPMCANSAHAMAYTCSSADNTSVSSSSRASSNNSVSPPATTSHGFHVSATEQADHDASADARTSVQDPSIAKAFFDSPTYEAFKVRT